ncbi:MAG: tRNA preQ1(34) S-adenosylmethionine ribosyltransferase-isomerase QueA [Pseudomonadota bacterium]
MRTSDFHYELPKELIAQVPPEKRDGGRLMVLNRRTGATKHCHITDLPRLLSGFLMVVNDSRVIPARIAARRATGGKVEVLLLESIAPGLWQCMVQSSKLLRKGEVLCVELQGSSMTTLNVRTSPKAGRCQIELPKDWLLEEMGAPPLPPYIQRPIQKEDWDRYQTVYAKQDGSVAAPTTGLHFSDNLLGKIKEQETDIVSVTLHVGPGTFVPVREELLAAHHMEEERYEVPTTTAEAIYCARKAGKKILAVGTTVVRTLETTEGRSGQGRTDLFITPGFQFQAIDALLTNFHLPCSTLLMLVCAFAGKEHVLAAYREAVSMRYRFYSYGDAMLIV